jgi:hypothetical protein
VEVELELVTPDMVWKPELAGSQKGSVQALVERWLTSFLEVSSFPSAADSWAHHLLGSDSWSLCSNIGDPGCRPEVSRKC